MVNTNSQFKDKQIVITGGCGNLGYFVSKAFLDTGAIVHIPTILPSKNKMLASLEHYSKLHVKYKIDLSDEHSVIDYYNNLPTIEASINLVGGFLYKNFVETTKGELLQQFEINLVTTFLCSRESLKKLDNDGSIINISSKAALKNKQESIFAYSLSKIAISNLSEIIAEESKHKNIRVNTIAPGTIDTIANRKSMPDEDFTKWVDPRHIADLILYLCSKDNKLINNSILEV